MAFSRVRDILDRARVFHEQLSGFYANMEKTADREKSRILLNYMSRHEQNMVECLARYEKEAANRVLDTWFKFPPEMKECRCFECVDLKPSMSLDDIIDVALKVDQCLLKLYSETAEKSNSQEVRDLFRKLLELEQKEETECLRNALHYEQEL